MTVLCSVCHEMGKFRYQNWLFQRKSTNGYNFRMISIWAIMQVNVLKEYAKQRGLWSACTPTQSNQSLCYLINRFLRIHQLLIWIGDGVCVCVCGRVGGLGWSNCVYAIFSMHGYTKPLKKCILHASSKKNHKIFILNILNDANLYKFMAKNWTNQWNFITNSGTFPSEHYKKNTNFVDHN